MIAIGISLSSGVLWSHQVLLLPIDGVWFHSIQTLVDTQKYVAFRIIIVLHTLVRMRDYVLKASHKFEITVLKLTFLKTTADM